MNDDRPPGPIQQTKAVLSWIAFIAGVLAVSVEVFLRRSRTFGERYMGVQAALVILLVPIYCAWWGGYDVRPLFYFLAAYLFMCLVIRIGGILERRRGGAPQHSRYNGFPRLCRLFPRVREVTVKSIIEPAVVFLVGVFMMPVSEPLGSYLMLASSGLLLSVNLLVGYERMRAMDMQDAAIEQRDLAESLRNGRDRWN
ncbi:MAG: hypothetical protein HUU22_11045 [Phycisphaerae bacterium]|nr:hypothetical protein [Phycisphaerae bacterium]NUQ46559.1 hypothetical protein [Phycisphaerae bacterium]